MVAILEVPSLRQRVHPISVREYEAVGELTGKQRTELIRGVIFKKMTISPLHSFIVSRVRRKVEAILSGNTYCRQEQPLKLADSMPEPDLAFVVGTEQDYHRVHPKTALLVVEAAVSSTDLDHEKASLYAEANVPEYWIVLANQAAVEVYSAPQAGTYRQRRLYAHDETLVSTSLPALRVDVGELFPEADV